ncbi:MAG TPA: asparaginase, partial [Actinomycetota bacterium]|nr:asparaginase [Actinomycetota bacterium]
MPEPLVVDVVRSGVRESSHLVDVAVIDQGGALVAWAGDPEQPAAFRSSAKPLQARVAVEAGWVPSDARALAIACASHNGEPEHIEAVRAVLAAGGVDEGALRCPADVPMYLPAVMGVHERAPVYHNCSGKHAAMLVACTASGWPLESYRDPDHPLQRAVTALVEEMVGKISATLTDGCGVPTFVAPLRALARGLLAIEGGPEAEAMRAHPFLVGGTERLDTDLMTAAPQVLIKSGAEGLACVAVAGLGIALKARDGAARARGQAVL